MNILIVGGGGREHALAWKIAQSPRCSSLYIAPGNAGTAMIGHNIPVDVMNFEEIKSVVLEKCIDLIIIGPDDPLGAGIVDYLQTDERLRNVAIVGPTAAGARLEASKSFAKAFMNRHNIPTARYACFAAIERPQAEEYIHSHGIPIVMKANGLAAGKGVSICHNTTEAIDFLDQAWKENRYGSSGNTVVIEEYLSGIEFSVFILTDGKGYVLLPVAKDYKRVGEGNSGENTGGMGAVSPPPFVDETLMQQVEKKIIIPTLAGLQEERIDYCGFIFFGLIKVNDEPYVIEYNARLGDPETQVILPRIQTDIVPLLVDAAQKTLRHTAIETMDEYAAAVIAVSKGYPGAFEKGFDISLPKDELLFMAGIKQKDNGLKTSGGRVCAAVGIDASLPTAIQKAYAIIDEITFENKSFRKDIGTDLLPAT